jgi:superfamily II DNA or RNA helicase
MKTQPAAVSTPFANLDHSQQRQGVMTAVLTASSNKFSRNVPKTAKSSGFEQTYDKSKNSLFVHEYDLAFARRHPSMTEPETHQWQALTNLHSWNDNNQFPKGGLMIFPTGGGKTFAAVRFLCNGPLSRGYKVLWLAHTHHLLNQAFDSFGSGHVAAEQEVGHISGPRDKLTIRVVSGPARYSKIQDIKDSDDVVIATLQSVTRAYSEPQNNGLHAFLESAKDGLIVVFDEAHHASASSYWGFLNALREQNPAMVLLGLTATPSHSDDERQARIKSLFPQGILYRVSPNELIAKGILAQPIIKYLPTDFVPEFSAPDYQEWSSGPFKDLPDHVIEFLALNKNRNEMIVNHYVQNRAMYGKTIIFTDRWVQCEAIKELLIQRGIRAGAIYSKVGLTGVISEGQEHKKGRRNEPVLEAFRQGELDVLVNVRMLAEGTNLPRVQSVFLTRQINSQILLSQMVGRALRGPKFGGTKVANIVMFTDRWQQPMQFAYLDDISVGVSVNTGHQYTQRPPLERISIDLVSGLSRMMDSGSMGSTLPFLEWRAEGWYCVEYAVAGRDDETEMVKQLVTVYGDERLGFRGFIDHVLNQPGEFSDLAIEFHSVQESIRQLAQRFFKDARRVKLDDLHLEMFQVARHVGQNDSAPSFFMLDDHDLDALAQQVLARDLGPRAQEDFLRNEHHWFDRFWESMCLKFEQFKRQFQACLSRILQLERKSAGATDESVVAR